MDEIVYLNGSLIPKREASVSVADYGFLYGYGLFETMRAYGGVIFRLESHLERLIGSANELGITVDSSVLRQAVYDTLKANSLGNARVRLAVSAGEGSLVPDINSCRTPTVLVTAAGYTTLSEDVYVKGYRLITSDIRRNSRSPVSRLKTANYLECLLARQRAKADGYDEALLLNEAGCIAEAATANIFIVSQGTVVTPDEESGILPGITRDVIIELCKKLGIGIELRQILADEIVEADEAFISNSIVEIMPVTEIDGKSIGYGVAGSLTNLLRVAYRETVERETN